MLNFNNHEECMRWELVSEKMPPQRENCLFLHKTGSFFIGKLIGNFVTQASRPQKFNINDGEIVKYMRVKR